MKLDLHRSRILHVPLYHISDKLYVTLLCKAYMVLDCVYANMPLKVDLGLTFRFSTKYSRYVDDCEVLLFRANLLYL